MQSLSKTGHIFILLLSSSQPYGAFYCLEAIFTLQHSYQLHLWPQPAAVFIEKRNPIVLLAQHLAN